MKVVCVSVPAGDNAFNCMYVCMRASRCSRYSLRIGSYGKFGEKESGPSGGDGSAAVHDARGAGLRERQSIDNHLDNYTCLYPHYPYTLGVLSYKKIFFSSF